MFTIVGYCEKSDLPIKQTGTPDLSQTAAIVSKRHLKIQTVGWGE